MTAAEHAGSHGLDLARGETRDLAYRLGDVVAAGGAESGVGCLALGEGGGVAVAAGEAAGAAVGAGQAVPYSLRPCIDGGGDTR